MSSKSEAGALPGGHGDGLENPRRRDFLYIATGIAGAAGIGAAVWPFIDSMNPATDVLALASIEVDIGGIPVGQRITVKWRGHPLFIDHRSEQEITEAENVDLAALRDPEADADRVKRKQWLVVVGVCTHLGCIPLGQKSDSSRGEFGGWFCPCHASQYDTSGRIRKGPAPRNLAVPDYAFLDDNRLRIG